MIKLLSSYVLKVKGATLEFVLNSKNLYYKFVVNCLRHCVCVCVCVYTRTLVEDDILIQDTTKKFAEFEQIDPSTYLSKYTIFLHISVDIPLWYFD